MGHALITGENCYYEESINMEKLQANNNNFSTITSLLKLPDELLYMIISFLGIIEKHILRFVCKKIHKIVHKYGSIKKNIFFLHADIDQHGNPVCEVAEYSICTMAARQGYLEIVEWIKQHMPIIFSISNKYLCYSAALGGKLELLKWARSNGCAWGGRFVFYNQILKI
jgi:hypothetical protein